MAKPRIKSDVLIVLNEQGGAMLRAMLAKPEHEAAAMLVNEAKCFRRPGGFVPYKWQDVEWYCDRPSVEAIERVLLMIADTMDGTEEGVTPYIEGSGYIFGIVEKIDDGENCCQGGGATFDDPFGVRLVRPRPFLTWTPS